MIVISSQNTQSERGRERHHICAGDRRSYWFTSISKTMAQVGLEVMPVSAFTLDSDCTLMVIVFKKNTTGTCDPVYFHWSGLIVVWHLTCSLCTPFLHNSLHWCFVKEKPFSLFYFMSKKNTNKQEMMTFAVHLSLLICSPGNKLAEGRFCLKAVHCVLSHLH